MAVGKVGKRGLGSSEYRLSLGHGQLTYFKAHPHLLWPPLWILLTKINVLPIPFRC